MEIERKRRHAGSNLAATQLIPLPQNLGGSLKIVNTFPSCQYWRSEGAVNMFHRKASVVKGLELELERKG